MKQGMGKPTSFLRMINNTLIITQNSDKYLSIISTSINSLYLTVLSHSVQVLHCHQICIFKTVQKAYNKVLSSISKHHGSLLNKHGAKYRTLLYSECGHKGYDTVQLCR